MQKVKSSGSTQKVYFLHLASVLVWCLTLVACSVEEAGTKIVKKELMLKADSIASLKIDSLRPIMDSLCQLKFEKELSILTDSLLEKRVEEMKQKLKENN